MGGAESAPARLGDGGVSARVGLALRRMLCADEPTLADVAIELCVSKRTLQHRLSEEDLHFSELLDGVRRDAAQEYLSPQAR